MNISPAESEIKYIRDALTQFNNEKVGADGHTPLSIVEYLLYLWIIFQMA